MLVRMVRAYSSVIESSEVKNTYPDTVDLRNHTTYLEYSIGCG